MEEQNAVALIRVDLEVREYIDTRKVHHRETRNEVLRRLLDLDRAEGRTETPEEVRAS